MVEVKVGVVEVFVIDPSGDTWKVLVLRRAEGTRCTGGWEVVHGRIEHGELPEGAAVREVSEETALQVQRLYNVTCNPFYLHKLAVVQMAVVFAAFADSSATVSLGAEHDAFEWVSIEEALDRLMWPRSRQGLRDIALLLAGGDAGPAEDVLRVF